MTPKEKAKKLVNTFSFYVVGQTGSSHEKGNAKYCALVAVEQIINTGTLVNRSSGYFTLNETHVEYWEQVKQEIELI